MTTTPPLLQLEGVSVAFKGTRAVDNVSLSVQRGERLALVGESGSGKTVTALSVLRLLRGAKVTGSVRLNGVELGGKTESELRRVRGAEVAMIFQEPMTALNPLFTVGNQIEETLIVHEGLSAGCAKKRAVELLSRTGVREPERRVDCYPHQLSGGERQRAMIAMALSCRPRLLIADEPTTALDLSVRARIVELLLELQREEAQRPDGSGMAILLITHDLPLVRRFAERVAVMERGRLVEVGTTRQIFEDAQHGYTRRLLASVPERQVRAVDAGAPVVLSARELRVTYRRPRGGLRGWLSADTFVALAGANLVLRAGETIGIVGESGSGKSTLAQAMLGLIEADSGELEFEGVSIARRRDRAFRSRLQVVFQDPFGSLSPRQTVRQIVGEGLALHFPELDEAERLAKIEGVLNDVGLARSALDSYPHEFSGGQRQRIAIARAIVLKPRVLVLDEPTSALDLSIQNQILKLLVGLQKKYGLSYVLVSHDLTVIRALAHRVYVMKNGELVESGETMRVIDQPEHDYTRSLIQAST
jgi:microcin C transport system ATP-binding protein